MSFGGQYMFTSLFKEALLEHPSFQSELVIYPICQR